MSLTERSPLSDTAAQERRTRSPRLAKFQPFPDNISLYLKQAVFLADVPYGTCARIYTKKDRKGVLVKVWEVYETHQRGNSKVSVETANGVERVFSGSTAAVRTDWKGKFLI